MPRRQLSVYHRRLNFRAALVRETIAEVEGRLLRYESEDLGLARAIVKDSQDNVDVAMILEEVRPHTEEQEGVGTSCAAWVRELHASPVTTFLEKTEQ